MHNAIGRTRTITDRLDPARAAALHATLGRDGPPPQAGDPLPPFWHYIQFWEPAPPAALGRDGHPKPGNFIPDTGLPRRMWAGSRVSFPGEIRVGDRVVRRSVIASIREKAGKSGALVFVTVRHEIGREGEPPAIVDEHDIVYRGLEAAPAAPTEVVPAGAWRRTLTPDAVLLFRYSALTFNGHRIHYDRDYVTGVEGYPGLVVHGPLTATLLVDLVRRNAPAARIDSFSFRAMSPLFDGNDMSVNAALPDADGRVRLWAANAEGRLAMAAEASLSGTVPS